MNDLKNSVGESKIVGSFSGLTRTNKMLLRLLRASQPVSRIEISRRMRINRSIVTDAFKPLIAAGVVREEQIERLAEGVRLQGRPPIGLSFASEREYFAGINIGVRHSQVGLTTLDGEILAEEDFLTPENPNAALEIIKSRLQSLCAKFSARKLEVIGVSVPGVTDSKRRTLVYAPRLDWRDVEIAASLEEIKFGKTKQKPKNVVENDATAAAVYESSLRLKKTTDGILKNFILVRSGTGIGVGFVIDGEVYRGIGKGKGLAGELGHTTIVAGGKPCYCGNRGCWERYAAASAASSLYTGDRLRLGESEPPRFVEIVERAEAGEIRAQKTLEKIGEYLGIGIGNVITGSGVPHVIVSGRIVYGWKFIREPLKEAVGLSMAGKITEWSVEAGEPTGAGLGGALEVAVEEFLAYGFNHIV